MLLHSKGYQKSITLIKTGRLNKKYNTNINALKEREGTGGETAMHRMLINQVASLVLRHSPFQIIQGQHN